MLITELCFLPAGADIDSAVYRAWSADGASYFVKLRRGAIDPLAVSIPRLLHARGMQAVIPTAATRSGELWSRLGGYTVTMSRYVAGLDGYARELTDAQWIGLGRALRGLHDLEANELLRRLPCEEFAPLFRARVREFLSQIGQVDPVDSVAAQLCELLRSRQAAIIGLLDRADELAASLIERNLRQVVCHGDFHAGNVLLGDDGSIYVVDWDTLVMAPRERDLMAIGMGGVWHGDRQAEQFYGGYGPQEVDSAAIAYFRCERIIQDIEAFCTELLLSGAGGSDRAQSLRYVTANVESGGLIDFALAS